MQSKSKPENSVQSDHLRVFMMDLWATVPYYTAYLSQALLAEGVRVQIGSITYYLDQGCFSSRGLKLDPGISDVAGRFATLPRVLRRLLKLGEGAVNIAALMLRFLFRAPDVVHVQYLPMLHSKFPMDLWFVRFCRWRGARIVLTVHDLLPHDTSDRYKELFKDLYSSMDALICHSENVKARLQQEFGQPASAINVIPHGPFFFDMPEGDPTTVLEGLGVKPGQRMVLWQGIIFPYKGVDLLLEAWSQLERDSPDLCLVVLGTGNPELIAHLQDQARRLELRGVNFNIRFCTVAELVGAYRAATMVIYPYRAITTSGALATGLALGKAIIASNLPVFEELLQHETHALLVNPADPSQLAESISRLAADPSLRAHLEASVREMRFGSESWRTIAIETKSLYRRLLESNHEA